MNTKSIFIVAAVVSILFVIVKFIEMRFIDKEERPLKVFVRDALVVYFSVVGGCFLMDQLKQMTAAGGTGSVVGDVLGGGGTSGTNGAPPVFLDNPNF